MGIAAEYVTKNGRLRLKFDAGSIKALFAGLQQIQEVFDEEACGCCGSKNIFANVRKHEKGTYYEYKCNDCRAALALHQQKEENGGGWYIKRYTPTKGWEKYEPPGESKRNPEPQSTARPSKPAPGPATDEVPF